MDSAVACKAAANGSNKLPAEPPANGAPVSIYALSPAAVTAQGNEVCLYDKDANSGDRRRANDSIVPSFFSHGDAFPKNMNQLLSLLEGVPPQTGLSSTAWASPFARWVAKEDDDAVYLKVPMPGLAKEHVKVRAEKNILVIKGEGDKEPGDDDSAVLTYNHRIEMPADAYKMDRIEIKGEMKNGVLWLIVLKVKDEERKDVFVVKVE